jgi:C-terminal processing protease CtpA/Prc
MFQVLADQKDSHLGTVAAVRYPSRFSKYVSLSIIDTIAIIKEVSPTFAMDYNLIKGDRIISYNNFSISKRIKIFEKYVRASNQTLTNYRIARKLLIMNKKDSVINIVISRNDSLINLSINYNTITAEPIIKNKFPDKFKIINDSVVYINIGKINDKEFFDYLKKSKNYNNIIFDCREYPTNLYKSKKWVQYLLLENGKYLVYQSPVKNKPGYTSQRSINIALNRYKPNTYRAKKFCKNKHFYLISSEQTQSKGEFTLLYLKALTNGIMIGRNTAGVPSEIIKIKLPYSINIDISAKKTFDNNNVLISGAGILPDISVDEDINDYNEMLKLIKLVK